MTQNEIQKLISQKKNANQEVDTVEDIPNKDEAEKE